MGWFAGWGGLWLGKEAAAPAMSTSEMSGPETWAGGRRTSCVMGRGSGERRRIYLEARYIFASGWELKPCLGRFGAASTATGIFGAKGHHRSAALSRRAYMVGGLSRLGRPWTRGNSHHHPHPS